ncbi:MAG: phosphopentomutase [Bacilli bacterium]|nr:phosphopentomutase [Bacilli bacterium]
MKKYQRIFVIVMDSLGVGEMPDAALFHDANSNTLKHIIEKAGPINAPSLEKLGMGDFVNIGFKKVNHPHSYTCIMRETSNGKDTMTGHWEMMGINTTKPFQTFTDTGFPQSLVDELSKATGYKFIGNYASSGTKIIELLGEEHMRDKSLILYTSSDSVLQIAAHEEVIPLQELYRVCEIARKICMKPEYFVGRIIARPFIGKDKTSFKRITGDRHDIAVSPSEATVLDILKENHVATVGVGKIGDIFNQQGIAQSIKTRSNVEGMKVTIDLAKKENNPGLYFVNLVEFDSEFGHRRDPKGYKGCIEEFDQYLTKLLPVMHDDDLLILTADHGNDPTMPGSDHTREKVPFIAYSKQISGGKMLSERSTFADIGASVLFNFNLKKKPHLLGKEIPELFL